MAIEYYTTDLPGKKLYDIPFITKIRKVNIMEIKYASSLFQKQEATVKEYMDFITKFIEFDNPEMNVSKLFWYDLQYLLYQIRYRTFKNYPIKLSFACDGKKEDGSDCEKEFQVPLDIGALIPIEPSDIEGFTDTIELENLGKVKIRAKLVEDDIKIEEFAKQKDLSLDDIDTLIMLSNFCAITTSLTLEEVYEYAQDGTLTIEDLMKIEDWRLKNVWGMKEEIKVKCPVCGKEEVRPFKLSLTDYFSEYRY